MTELDAWNDEMATESQEQATNEVEVMEVEVMESENTPEYSVVEYNEVAATIEAIKVASDFAPDMSTPEGYEKSKRFSLNVAKGLTKLETARKREKKHWLDGGRNIDTGAKEIREAIEKYQLPHKEAYQAVDQKAKDKIAKHKNEVQKLILLTSTARTNRWSSEKIKKMIAELNDDIDCVKYGPSADDAKLQKPNVIVGLDALYIEVVKDEKAAAEFAEFKHKQDAERSTCEKCEMLIALIESEYTKNRDTCSPQAPLPEYEDSVVKKQVDEIMNQVAVA